jgi:hypothetical protein
VRLQPLPFRLSACWRPSASYTGVVVTLQGGLPARGAGGGPGAGGGVVTPGAAAAVGGDGVGLALQAQRIVGITQDHAAALGGLAQQAAGGAEARIGRERGQQAKARIGAEMGLRLHATRGLNERAVVRPRAWWWLPWRPGQW